MRRDHDNREMKLRAVSGLVVAALMLTLAATRSDARTFGAFAGRPLDNAPMSCFAESGGAVTGTGAAGCVGTPFRIVRGGRFRCRFSWRT